MIKFKPSDNYEELKKQAYGLFNLLQNQEKEIAFYRNKYSGQKLEKEIDILKKLLESEKDMNRMLTEEVDRYECLYGQYND